MYEKMENLCTVCLSSDRRMFEISKSLVDLIKMILPELYITKLCFECMARFKQLSQLRQKALDSRKEILDRHLYASLATSTISQSKTNLQKSDIFIISLCDFDVPFKEERRVTNDNQNILPKLLSNVEIKNNQESEGSSSNIQSVNDSMNISSKLSDNINLKISNNTIACFNKAGKGISKRKTSVPLNQYACSECKESFTSSGKYDYHRLKHRDRIKCDICTRDFSSRSSLNAHVNVVHSTGPRPDDSYRYFCTPCEKFFKSYCSYRKHVRTSLPHVDPETLRYSCPVCSKRYRSSDLCDKHHQRVHMHQDRLQCSWCYRQYCSVQALRCHLRRRHATFVTGRSYVCEICEGSALLLKRHQRLHTEEMDETADDKDRSKK